MMRHAQEQRLRCRQFGDALLFQVSALSSYYITIDTDEAVSFRYWFFKERCKRSPARWVCGSARRRTLTFVTVSFIFCGLVPAVHFRFGIYYIWRVL